MNKKPYLNDHKLFDFLIEYLKIDGCLAEMESFHKDCQSQAKIIDSQSCADCSHKTYFDNNEINYNCEIKTYIYACRLMPCHASEIYNGLINHGNNILKDYSQNLSDFKAISYGSGSGTDIIALLKAFNYLKNVEKQQISSLNILRIDDAMDNWNPIVDKVEKFLREKVFCNFKFFIETNPSKFQKNDTDIIVCSYLISELDTEQIEVVKNNILSFAKNKFLLVINDRKQDVVKGKVDKLLNDIIDYGFKQTQFKQFRYSKKDTMNNNDSPVFNELETIETNKDIGRAHAGNMFSDENKNMFQIKLNMHSFFTIVEFSR